MSVKKYASNREHINDLAEDVAIELLRHLKKEVRRHRFDISLDDEPHIKNIKTIVHAISAMSHRPMQVYSYSEKPGVCDEYAAEINELYNNIVLPKQV